MGMWGVMVPLRSTDLGLSELMISGFLLIIGLSLCAAIFLVTRVKALQDDGQLIRFSGPVYAGGFTVCLVTGSLPVFFGAGMVTGLAAGFLDADLNSQSSQWEQKAGKRSMSGFHALFSLGMLLGAGLVTWLLSGGHDPAVGIITCAVLYGGYIVTNRSWLAAAAPADEADRPRPGAPLRLSLAVILFLGACISLSSLVEGGVIDWSALHLNRVLSLPADEAGRAVLFFSVAMTVARFMGDRLGAFVAPNLILAVPLVIAGVLLTTAVITAHVPLLVWAYIFIGLAVANAFPIIISEAGRAAGDQPLREISVIVGFAYFGLISGPALFGVLAHLLGLDATILAIAGMAFLLGVASLARPRFVAGAGTLTDPVNRR